MRTPRINKPDFLKSILPLNVIFVSKLLLSRQCAVYIKQKDTLHLIYHSNQKFARFSPAFILCGNIIFATKTAQRAISLAKGELH